MCEWEDEKMKSMKFGNWKVTQEGIEWDGPGNHAFMIPATELVAERPGILSTPTTYEWIMRATDMHWLEEDDLYDLNYAFVYAAARFGLNFSYETFDDTLEEQYERFEEDEDDDEY